MGAAARHADGVDDDVDSVSPRTLKQAADRLAQFTSDQPAGQLTPQVTPATLEARMHICIT